MNRKLDDAEATGALEIVTDNQGASCSSAVAATLRAATEVLHLAQLVAEGSTRARAPRGRSNGTLSRVQPDSDQMAPRPLDPRPKAVIFDLDDTLCDYAAAREARLRQAFTLSHDGGTQSRRDRSRPHDRRVDSMHPHGADHFEELFARFGIADARQARPRPTGIARTGFTAYACFQVWKRCSRWCEMPCHVTIPRQLARSGS